MVARPISSSFRRPADILAELSADAHDEKSSAPRPAKRAVKSADNFTNLGPRERVVDLLSAPASSYQTIGPQPGQLLGNGGLPQTQRLFDFCYRLLAIDQQTENNQPNLMRKRFEKFACISGLLDQRIQVLILLCGPAPALLVSVNVH
jgi:hypothetical protein